MQYFSMWNPIVGKVAQHTHDLAEILHAGAAIDEIFRYLFFTE